MSVMLLALAAAAATPIAPARIRADVRALSSDAFLGRGPGEEGEAKTVAYLQGAMAQARLEPAGDNGGWTQAVPLVRLDRLPGATLTLTSKGRSVPLALGRDATLALRNAGDTRLTQAPLVFGGFGVIGQGFDPYQGVDLRGRIVVVLANDPDFEGGRDLGFEGRRLAYGGRVGVKFEAAAKAGALGVLVIHEDAAASYPFAQLGNGDPLPAFAYAPLQPSPLKLSGWLSGGAAGRLLAERGLSLARLKTLARDPSFRATPLADLTLSAAGSVRATPVTSYNVIGRLPGTTRPDETILYGAHWDANGRNGPDARGDAIRNGAIDNATGTAALLEVARAFTSGARPPRTVLFAAWTAEEKGLLGSDWFAAHPPVSLDKMVAVINLDAHVVLPAARNLELIGGGRTTLEGDLRIAAARLGLRVDDEPNPEAGWYFRSDHFPFARRGVPALAFRGGRDLVSGGVKAGDALVSAYNTRCYHQPCDEFDAGWTFAGTAQEASAAYLVGRELATGTGWPDWLPGVEYKATRDKSAATRR